MHRFALAFAAALLLPAAGGGAAELPRQPVLTLDAARAVLAAAEKEADSNHWAGSIAVTDAGGALLALVRLDGGAPASAEIAPGKARTAALFRRPTAGFEDAINGPRPAAITAGFTMMAGGLPLVVDGQVVGAIGASVDTPQHDVVVAEAGLAALPR